MNENVIYHGSRNEAGGSVVAVETAAGELLGTLRHVERHSPGGFSWGYGGSGPADLARSLLLAALGDAAACLLCRARRQVVLTETGEGLPYEDGDDVNPELIAKCVCSDGYRSVPYQEFKWKFVAGWGAEWKMSRTEILAWLHANGIEA